MTNLNNAAFVLVHGAWHDHHTWDALVPLLERGGHPVLTLDLPGAGIHAAVPASFRVRPIDLTVFATEPSPNAGVGQAERTEATIAAVRKAALLGNGKVVLVGHSLGGLTISPVAESIPDTLSAVVYLSAFLLAPGMVAGEMTGHPTMADSKVPLSADPSQVGALRLDTASDDPKYLSTLKAAFYGDLTDAQFSVVITHLHPDEPVQVCGVPSNITSDRFGTVARHYIRCERDQAVTLAAQDFMIDSVDVAMGNSTIVHTMETSHSPFNSDPAGLAKILMSTLN
jgi:pimeloyl-ACP methyl ester carboxylesterase